jgi:hypothetical protein
LGLLVAQGTSPLWLAVVVTFLAVFFVTSGGSNRRQGDEAVARLLVADGVRAQRFCTPFLFREHRCTQQQGKCWLALSDRPDNWDWDLGMWRTLRAGGGVSTSDKMEAKSGERDRPVGDRRILGASQVELDLCSTGSLTSRMAG